MGRRTTTGLDLMLAPWGTCTRLAREGRSIDWPPHLLLIRLAVMRMPPDLRRAIEARYASRPGADPYERAASVAMNWTTYAGALRAGLAFVEGYLSAANEPAGPGGRRTMAVRTFRS